MSEHEESAGPDATIPGQPAGHHETGPSSKARTRGQRAAQVAGAVTSRTAGWMVAAALAGSLVTVLLDGGTSQPATGQVTLRNIGRAAPAPAGVRTSWRIEATPLTPKQVYVAPGDPLASGTVTPGCAFPGPGIPPGAVRHSRSLKISGWQQIVIGRKGHRASWVAIGSGPPRKRIALVRPGCRVRPLHCGAALGVRIGWAPAGKRIMIKRHGSVVIIGPGGRPQRHVRTRARAGQRIRPVVPAAPSGWGPFPGCAVYLPASPVPGR